jgi:hypothetical protein
VSVQQNEIRMGFILTNEAVIAGLTHYCPEISWNRVS